MALPTDLPTLLARVDALRDEIDALRPLSDEQEGRAMQRLRLEWTYHSNAIEGNSLTYGETRALLMHGVTAHGKPLKDHLDIRRHREVIDHLEDVVRSDEPLTLAALREMHRMLMGDAYEVSAEAPDGSRVTRTAPGGAFKTLPNNVVTETGETHYYASPEVTPALMTDLVDGLRETEGDAHPVVRAALFHHRFVEIHPFPDGNGRTARVLMNLLLMRAGFVPAVLRQERRPAYYGALAEADDGGDTEPIVAFVAEELAETMGLYLRALKEEPDPSAFSKRVALLERDVETTETSEMTPSRRAKVSNEFVLPLVDQLGRVSAEMSRLFQDRKVSFQVMPHERSVYEDGPGGRHRIESGEWSRFQWRCRFIRLRSKPLFSLTVDVEGRVGLEQFVLLVKPSDITKTYPGDQLPGEDEASRLVSSLAEEMVSAVEEGIRE